MSENAVLTLTIPDRDALHRAYMPFVLGGGLFVATPREYDLGEEVFLLVTLEDVHERLPIPGKVAWITPPGAQGNRRAGVGIQFSPTADGEHARNVIESHLAGVIEREQKTDTL